MNAEAEDVDFSEDLEGLYERRDELKKQVEELREKLSKKTEHFQQLRQDIEAYKQSEETGQVPFTGSGKGEGRPGAHIDRVQVDDETGKPKRGRRAEQIWQAIEYVTEVEGKSKFKAADLFDAIKQADPNFDETHRAYLYSKLNKLRDNNKLEKIKRGTWQRLD